MIAMGCGIVVAAGVLVSCTDASSAGPGPSASSPAVSPPPADSAPVLAADGTAADNLPLFSSVTAQVWASEARSHGRAYIDALVDAGFSRDRMQVTADLSTVGQQAESLQFSVAWGATECLIGQVGPATGEPVTAVMPQLAHGRCLVGMTRPIDW